MKQTQIIQDYFNETAESFYKDYSGNNNLGKDIVNRYLEVLLPKVSQKKVLEIGCGSAAFTTHVSKFSQTTVGIDFSKNMLNIAKKADTKTLFSLADGLSLPFKDKSFDIIYSFRTLQHIPNLKRALAEIIRILKNDGTLIFDFINLLSPMGFIRCKLSYFSKHVYLKALSPAQIDQMCNELDLSILQLKPLQFFVDSSNLDKYLPQSISQLAIPFFKTIDHPKEKSWLSKFSTRFVVIAKKGEYQYAKNSDE